MPRRAGVIKRELAADARFNSLMVSRLINRIMLNGDKSVAENIIYDALEITEQKEKKDPVGVLEQAVKNITPLLEVKPRRVGGATYQVPVEVRPGRSLSLALRWLVKAARARGGKSMAEKLAAEIADASREQGAAAKKKEDTHRMAEANRAFAHYRW
jgi:small subunit ribosomal protein S7